MVTTIFHVHYNESNNLQEKQTIFIIFGHKMSYEYDNYTICFFLFDFE